MSELSPSGALVAGAQGPAAHAVVIGGGPAGLMAAESLCAQGVSVDLYDAMASVGRKFLLAGRGGLNLTHAEPQSQFCSRYFERSAELAPYLEDFGADALRAWAAALGIDTFVGSSGKVFPEGMKAAPLLRAWLQRLRRQGVRFHMRHRWLGWDSGAPDSSARDANTAGSDIPDADSPDAAIPDAAIPDAGARAFLRFATPDGVHTVTADAVVLALGGGSWARLGSDGAWVPLLQARCVDVAPLKPSNCGFECGWSPHFQARHGGQPLKSIVATFTDLQGRVHQRAGEMLVTATGLEGSLIYAWSAMLRETVAARGHATITLDLAPERSAQRISAEVDHPRGSRSWSSHLQSRAGIHGVKAGLLRECLGAVAYETPALLSAAIKALPITLDGIRPLDEAISSAGGVRFEALDAQLMTHAMDGVFCCGEMLDWEAPTGGYLLTACMASGRAAGLGAAHWLAAQPR